MDQVTTPQIRPGNDPHGDIAWLQRNLSTTFAELPAIEAEWGEMDNFEKMELVEEWPITEGHVKDLDAYAAQGIMTPQERQQYDAFKRLEAQNRPIIERLRGPTISMAESRRLQGIDG